jgi:membrane associated rhomboid family serine protease
MRTPIARREGDPSWMRPITERLSPVIGLLAVVDALLFCSYMAVAPTRRFFEEHLALGPNALVRELWQPLTALFVHLEPLSFFLGILGLWFIGTGVQRTLGTRRFLMIFFVTGIAGNVTTALLARFLGDVTLSAGCGPAVLALFVAYGVAFGRTSTPMPGGLVLESRTMVLAMVGFSLAVELAQGLVARFVGTVVALALGYLLAGGRGQEWKRTSGGTKGKRARRRYQVLDGGRSGPPGRSGSSGPTPYLN